MRKVVFCTLFVLVFIGSVHAVNGSTTISSELYSFEDGSKTHTQYFQSLKSRINLYYKDIKRVDFSTYGKWRTDFHNKSETDPQLFIYNMQISLKNFVKSSKFILGRQFVYSNVGSALIDGLSIKSSLIPNSEISINVGAEVNRLNPDKIQNVSDNLIGGVRYKYKFNRSTTVGLNWFLRNYQNQVTTNRLGFDATKKIQSVSLYTRLTYDFSLMSLSDILLRGSYRFDKWYLSIEGRHREPMVYANSLFAIIDSKKYKRSRIEVQYTINKTTRLISQIRYALYEDKNTVSGSIGIRYTNLSLFYNFQNGRGTENNGISGTLSHNIDKMTSLYASMSLSRYKIQEDYDELSDSYSTAIGVVKSFADTWQARGEWQYLRNAVESSNSRIYIKLSKQLAIE